MRAEPASVAAPHHPDRVTEEHPEAVSRLLGTDLRKVAETEPDVDFAADQVAKDVGEHVAGGAE